MLKGKKSTGGKYHASRKKRKHEIPGIPRIVKLKQRKLKILRVRGGNIKPVLLGEDTANIISKNGKAKRAKIKNVLETPSDKFLARQNIIVKGALIDTELGKARVTNRPGQEGCVNAMLIE